MKPQEIAAEKCRCFGGPILLAHFAGKVLDLNLRACRVSQKAGRAGDFRHGPPCIASVMSELPRQPANYFAS